MAVVVSIARGHDASYPFKTIGAADGADLGQLQTQPRAGAVGG